MSLQVMLSVLLTAAGPLMAQTPVETLAHVRNEFEFTVHASYDRVAPLFGAYAERAWAGPDWNPQAVYPAAAEAVPAKDVRGEVFTISHGEHAATWINTALDFQAGYIQYAYFIPGAMVALIDVHVAKLASAATHVNVVYERTALSAAANAHVKAMGESDRGSGPHWQAAIEAFLNRESKGR